VYDAGGWCWVLLLLRLALSQAAAFYSEKGKEKQKVADNTPQITF
jgi:hypothetical protein